MSNFTKLVQHDKLLKEQYRADAETVTLVDITYFLQDVYVELEQTQDSSQQRKLEAMRRYWGNVGYLKSALDSSSPDREVVDEKAEVTTPRPGTTIPSSLPTLTPYQYQSAYNSILRRHYSLKKTYQNDTNAVTLPEITRLLQNIHPLLEHVKVNDSSKTNEITTIQSYWGEIAFTKSTSDPVPDQFGKTPKLLDIEDMKQNPLGYIVLAAIIIIFLIISILIELSFLP